MGSFNEANEMMDYYSDLSRLANNLKLLVEWIKESEDFLIVIPEADHFIMTDAKGNKVSVAMIGEDHLTVRIYFYDKYEKFTKKCPSYEEMRDAIIDHYRGGKGSRSGRYVRENAENGWYYDRVTY